AHNFASYPLFNKNEVSHCMYTLYNRRKICTLVFVPNQRELEEGTVEVQLFAMMKKVHTLMELFLGVRRMATFTVE
ncbi:unnamed protein product, partial [Allacma fusca]